MGFFVRSRRQADSFFRRGRFGRVVFGELFCVRDLRGFTFVTGTRVQCLCDSALTVSCDCWLFVFCQQGIKEMTACRFSERDTTNMDACFRKDRKRPGDFYIAGHEHPSPLEEPG